MSYRVLVDTSSLMYRAFFSTPPTVAAGDGQPVNAVHGYLDMTSRLVGSRRPDRAVHVYDADWRPASRYADFAVLRGDPSDGLPGVRGVGEKTARILVNAYPSLDALVEDALAEKRAGPPHQRSPALRAAIREAVDYLKSMRAVVPIRTDLDVRAWERDRDDPELD